MAIFKCKMCGGTLEIGGETVATCEYCGTQQTLPRIEDDRRANLYDRANHFRRGNEFDKAMGIYEQILNEDSTDAEAYWCLVLCHYGIEYVEDPATHKRVPTVNRAQYTSIFADENYKSALQYADGGQRMIYEQEAKEIDEIQKGILSISQKEEPFDVFICYKETDNNGRRTPDSVLANDLYHQLTQEGFKVFFARITLEDKLGSAYEPYIFAALNSAKVMVVLGTRPEFFNAVWVKNEWSRYLTLIRGGANKMIIPAYRDMDPYDLPEEFSHLQAQDMSKLGFMQDIIRGIKKIVSIDAPKPTVIRESGVSGGANPEALLKRAFFFLEDGDWKSTDEYCERVLDMDPECAEAYLGKLLASVKVRKIENLENCELPFESNANYRKAVRFADKKLAQELEAICREVFYKSGKIQMRDAEGWISGEIAKWYAELFTVKKWSTYDKWEECYKCLDAAIETFSKLSSYKDADTLAEECVRIKKEKEDIQKEENRLEAVYTNAIKTMETAQSGKAYQQAAAEFTAISGYKDADALAQACEEKYDEFFSKLYKDAKDYMSLQALPSQERALAAFKNCSGYKDADELAAICEGNVEALRQKKEREEMEVRRAMIEREKRLEKNEKMQKKNDAILLPICNCQVKVDTPKSKTNRSPVRFYTELGFYSPRRQLTVGC